jgi:hypothetical protein
VSEGGGKVGGRGKPWPNRYHLNTRCRRPGWRPSREAEKIEEKTTNTLFTVSLPAAFNQVVKFNFCPDSEVIEKEERKERRGKSLP